MALACGASSPQAQDTQQLPFCFQNDGMAPSPFGASLTHVQAEPASEDVVPQMRQDMAPNRTMIDPVLDGHTDQWAAMDYELRLLAMNRLPFQMLRYLVSLTTEIHFEIRPLVQIQQAP